MALLLISSSNVHGYGYLDHAEPDIKRLLQGLKKVAFIPFALTNRDAYTEKVGARLSLMGFETIQVKGPKDLDAADAVFVGGGNTFRLLKALYETGVLEAIQKAARGGKPYIGSSAGTNVTSPTIKTTNDMPIVYPPSFDALNLVHYQINPHYLDPEPDSKHKGETREERIREFLEENDTPVVGLREGTMLWVENGTSTLLGLRPARIFRRGSEPQEIEVGSTIGL